MSVRDKLVKLVDGENLSFEEAYELFNEMLGESEVRIAAVLSTLQTKGYTYEEVAGFAKAMREKAVKVNAGDVLDTCGTGGDRSGTINVSTAVAILSSCFLPVAKHGNVSVTSKSGSANVLEALEVEIRLKPEDAERMLKECNFAFLFAPLYHPTLKKIMPVRKELGIKTIFNILGPLCNPANPSYQLLGVSDESLLEIVSNALRMLEVKHALVVHGECEGLKLDEISPYGKTAVAEVSGRENVEFYELTPEEFGVKAVKPVRCESAEESASRIEAVFSGKGKEEDVNFVLINASASLYASGVVGDFQEGVELAKSAIESGEVKRKLEEIRGFKALRS